MNIVPEGRHIFLSINGETNVFIDQERSGKSVVHTLREEDLRAGLHLTYQSNNLREESGKLFVWGITDNGDFQTFNGSWDVGEPIQWSDIEP